jgi:hypothetical protein
MNFLCLPKEREVLARLKLQWLLSNARPQDCTALLSNARPQDCTALWLRALVEVCGHVPVEPSLVELEDHFVTQCNVQ